MIFIKMFSAVIKLLKSAYLYLRSFIIPENADEHRLCYRLLSEEKSQGVMFDVGAHHGDVLAPFASDGWKVYAFEPDAENRRKLTSRYQSQPEVIVDPRAVAEKSRKTAPLYRSEESSGLSTLAPFRESHCAIGEFEDSKTQKLNYSFKDLAEFLVGKNYQLIISEWYPIQRYGTTHQWRRFCTYPCSLQDPGGWGNIMACRDRRLYRKMIDYCGLSSS